MSTVRLTVAQALTCLQVGALRAAVVFLWTGAVATLRDDVWTAGASMINVCDLSLIDSAALMKHADLFVGPNSGPMNIAAAVGIRVVGLFGPSDPAIWGPCGVGHRIFYKQLDCRSCFHPDCFRGDENCMRLISLDEVWQAVWNLLQEKPCRKN